MLNLEDRTLLSEVFAVADGGSERPWRDSVNCGGVSVGAIPWYAERRAKRTAALQEQIRFHGSLDEPIVVEGSGYIQKDVYRRELRSS